MQLQNATVATAMSFLGLPRSFQACLHLRYCNLNFLFHAWRSSISFRSIRDFASEAMDFFSVFHIIFTGLLWAHRYDVHLSCFAHPSVFPEDSRLILALRAPFRARVLIQYPGTGPQSPFYHPREFQHSFSPTTVSSPSRPPLDSLFHGS